MRRVFPLRQADNGSCADAEGLRRNLLEHVEDPIKRIEEQHHAFGSSQKMSKLPNSCDSSTISGDENLNNINDSNVAVSRPPSHQKPPRASAYPIFTAVAPRRYISPLSSVSGKQKLSGEKQHTASISSNLLYDSQNNPLKGITEAKPGNQAERPISAPKSRPLSDTQKKYSLRTHSFRETQLPDNMAVLNGMDETCYHGFSDCQPYPSASHFRSLSFSASDTRFSESSELNSCSIKGTESLESFNSKRSSNGGKAGTGSSPFKYLSARMVAEKLVKVIGKEKIKAQANGPIGFRFPRVMMGENSCTSSKELAVHIEKENIKQGLCFKQPSLGSQHETDSNASADLSFANSIINESNNRNGKQASFCSFEHDFQHSLQARALAREELALSLDKESNLCDPKFRSHHSSRFAAETSMCDVSKWEQGISKLRSEKRDLALEVAHEIRARISEQNEAADRLRSMKRETELKLLAIEKEKDTLQENLKKELERRGNEWTANLEKMKSDERKLQGKIDELSEDKAELQIIVSLYKEKEAAWGEDRTQFESLVSSLKERLATSEAGMARQMQAYTGILEKVKASENEFVTLSQQEAFLQMENSELQNEMTRLRRVCNEQQMTVEGLCQELDETVNNSFGCRNESLLRLQRELLRLAGVEQCLRTEVNALRAELKLTLDKNAANVETPVDLVKLNQELQERIDKLKSIVFKLQEENNKLTLSLRATMRARKDAERTIKLYQLKKVTGATESVSLFERTAGILDCNRKASEGVDFSEHVVLQENLRVLNVKLQSKEAELKRLDAEFLEILHSKESLQMEVDDLCEKLLIANQHNRELKHEIDRKEVATEVIRADAERLGKELTNLQSELSSARKQGEKTQTVAEDMSREALRLTMELNTSKKALEKLEEELMLKEGQISILRGTYSNCDYLA